MRTLQDQDLFHPTKGKLLIRSTFFQRAPTPTPSPSPAPMRKRGRIESPDEDEDDEYIDRSDGKQKTEVAEKEVSYENPSLVKDSGECG